ncbi:MAG: tRNA-dihydrouridine synthase family protein [Spirochaetales bacterium]|nr:tRNA-dihydrouridine synthase family protein [Spirochaetales bacterium]
MVYSYAPMEGITTWWYRQVFARHFGGIDRFYTFFLTPRYGAVMGCDLRELEIEHNAGLAVIPQMMTNNSELARAFVSEIGEKGYREVNLNLGCPMQTVVGKQRASWFLGHPEELDNFLSGLFEDVKLPISIKTRIGFDDASIFPKLMGIFNRYPLSELIVHPRLRSDFYKGSVDMKAFDIAYSCSACPVAYNGDLFTPDSIASFRDRYPKVEHIMLGRGLICNPALAREAEGGERLRLDEFVHFHSDMQDTMREVMKGGDIYLDRMKEFWWYWCRLFEDGERLVKDVRKARKSADYNRAVDRLFANARLRERPYFL